MAFLCRDCFATETDPAYEGLNACPECGSDRVVLHPELDRLAIAHIDCDAFYASVEKRDNPELRDKPVIVGGGKRGVVTAACYMARPFGVRSAMPMFKALKACPDAVIVRPDMEKYGRVGREVRTLMQEVTPMVEPISIDEAFLDLTGTEKLHGGWAAKTLAALSLRIEDRVGITVTVGLSYNKFLAKFASGNFKPRGFAAIGEAEAVGFLAEQPVSRLWGVGKAMLTRLQRDGIDTIGDVQAIPEEEMILRYGALGQRLARHARGRDTRHVKPGSGRKSLSAESTFNEDHADLSALQKRLWPLCEKVSRRIKAEGIGGRTVTLKLKTAGFKSRTRAATLPDPTQLAEVIYRTGDRLLKKEATGTKFRLIGIGLSDFAPEADCDPQSLADPDASRMKDLEKSMDAVREKFGRDAISKGRGL